MILSHLQAYNLMKDEPKKYNLIYITHPDGVYYCPEAEQLPLLAKNILTILCHDVEFDRKFRVSPSKQHIQEIFDFTEGKQSKSRYDDLIFACHAGVSRSSAFAYVHRCKKYDAIDALSIFNPKKHCPNSLIIKLGSEMLDKPEMIDIINNWKMQHNGWE